MGAESGGAHPARAAEGGTPFPLAPVTIVAGHYGVGKTNLSVNLALDAKAAGAEVMLADLDVVNPYFRTSDYRALLEERGVRVISPTMAGSTLDSPSISGEVETAVEWAYRGDGGQRPLGRVLIIDAGGDDVGATVLGRFSKAVAQGAYDLLYVVNRSRNLTQAPAEAVAVLREIEAKARLSATAVANNTHLKQDTDERTVEQGESFARAVADLSGLPLAFTTLPLSLADRKSGPFHPNGGQPVYYPVQVYVRTPWE